LKNMFHLKNEAELLKWTKPIRDQKLKDDLGESASSLLLKHEKKIDKLQKEISGLHRSIENIQKRLMEMEMKG